MDNRHWAPCVAFETGLPAVADPSPATGASLATAASLATGRFPAMRRRRARIVHLTRQLQFERARLETVTALLGPGGPKGAPAQVNPARLAYARRLRRRILVLRLRITGLKLLATTEPRPCPGRLVTGR